jgi:predicted DNA-binding protein YlxM (UPF0122 family)
VKHIKMVLLMDYYGAMLTDKQQDMMDLYYNHDMSLAEIAQEFDVSRQAVMDSVKRGENILTNCEEKLGMAQKFQNLKKEINACISLNQKKDTQQVAKKLTEIKAILEDGDGV